MAGAAVDDDSIILVALAEAFEATDIEQVEQVAETAGWGRVAAVLEDAAALDVADDVDVAGLLVDVEDLDGELTMQ